MTLKKGDKAHTLVSVQTAGGLRMVPCLIERSRRARRMYLQFDCPEYVTLKLPMRSSQKAGLQFLQEHADWICEILDTHPKVTRLQHYLRKHPRLAISGYWHKLELQISSSFTGIEVDDEKRLVRITLDPEAPAEEELKVRLRGIAREFLPKRVRFLEPRVGVKAHGITIRDQKSRWGSCSETSALSLNWRLILIAPKLQDHVLLHELAHIRHFDHSSDFHAFLQKLDPNTRDHENKLHQVANRVFSLGR